MLLYDAAHWPHFKAVYNEDSSLTGLSQKGGTMLLKQKVHFMTVHPTLVSSSKFQSSKINVKPLIGTT